MDKQKYFSQFSMVVFIAFMNMAIPLSTDLYLPAMPEMGTYLGASNALVSLTLTIFFIVFAISIVLFGPIGGFLLTFTSWRGAFFLLTMFGAVNLLLALLLTETLLPTERYQGNTFHSLALLWQLTKQTRFMTILLMFSVLAAPYMAYLTVSPFVYVEGFSLTAQEYSYFFAINSVAAVIGPLMYIRLKKILSNCFLIVFCFVGAFISALSVLFLGYISAIAFLLSFIPFTIIESVARPFGMDILLNEARENIGTAAAMINFAPTLLGSLGMMAGTLPWPNFVDGLGIIMLSCVMLASILWRKEHRF